jgi:predicted phosphodiesterase
MKILHLSDLHLNRSWLTWACAAASRYDIVCVSGDLLDMFSRQTPLRGMLTIKEWADEFPGRMALCSGNHDGNGPELTPPAHLLTELSGEDRARAEQLMRQERWMDTLARADLVPDGRSELLPCGKRGVVVTTIPYDFSAVRWHEDLWQVGAQLRRDSGAPWIVLHHEPPAGTKVGGASGNDGLPYLVEEYQPNFLLSGHLHLEPYRGDFGSRIGATWCFNPGVPDGLSAAEVPKPNRIVIDLPEGTATWHYSSLPKGAEETRSLRLRA